MSTFTPRIAIAGGGPSGLALGLLLHNQGIQTTIYELRDKPTQDELAKPSGMLDLHEESGQAVMRRCGLWDTFQAALGDCSESMRVMNPQGDLLHSDDGGLESRPEIPRNSLTNMLVQNVPEEMMKWNHKITSVERVTNDTTGATEIVLDLGPNGKATYDFVVGADGAWSRVRKLLSDVKPFYSGAQYVTATVRNVTKNYPHLVELNGSGALAALGGCKGIMTHRGPQDSIRVYTGISTPHEHWAASVGLQGKTAAEVKTLLLGSEDLFKNWAPKLQDLISTACDEDTKDNLGEADIKPLYMLPIGHRWEHGANVTLLGDAAHLMTPWGGEGVNLALWDSLDLADALAAVPKTDSSAVWQQELDPLVKSFEEKILARAEEKARETDQHREMFLSEHGGQAMADMFKSFYG